MGGSLVVAPGNRSIDLERSDAVRAVPEEQVRPTQGFRRGTRPRPSGHNLPAAAGIRQREHPKRKLQVDGGRAADVVDGERRCLEALLVAEPDIERPAVGLAGEGAAVPTGILRAGPSQSGPRPRRPGSARRRRRRRSAHRPADRGWNRRPGPIPAGSGRRRAVATALRSCQRD